VTCTYCGSSEHPASHCPRTYGGSVARAVLRCSYCGATDHNYAGCSKHAGGGKLPGAVRLSPSGPLPGHMALALACMLRGRR